MNIDCLVESALFSILITSSDRNLTRKRYLRNVEMYVEMLKVEA